MSRTGRRPGDSGARRAILTAARSAFAANGFHAATIRAIASDAGVDPALVHHYFGSKEDLFAESIALPFRPADAAGIIMQHGLERAGEGAVRLFMSAWESQPTRDALLALLRGALTTEHGADALREFVGTALLVRIAAAMDIEDAEVRVALAAAHLVGVAVLRYVVGIEPLRAATVEELVVLVGPRLQSYFDG